MACNDASSFCEPDEPPNRRCAGEELEIRGFIVTVLCGMKCGKNPSNTTPSLVDLFNERRGAFSLPQNGSFATDKNKLLRVDR